MKTIDEADGEARSPAPPLACRASAPTTPSCEARQSDQRNVRRSSSGVGRRSSGVDRTCVRMQTPGARSCDTSPATTRRSAMQNAHVRTKRMRPHTTRSVFGAQRSTRRRQPRAADCGTRRMCRARPAPAPRGRVGAASTAGGARSPTHVDDDFRLDVRLAGRSARSHLDDVIEAGARLNRARRRRTGRRATLTAPHWARWSAD